MPLEYAGRADKNGNEYEYNCVIYEMLEVLQEERAYIQYEPIGNWSEGVDIIVGNFDGTREAQQCKSRNASKSEWDYSAIKSRKIIDSWKKLLDEEKSSYVSLVSPLAFPEFVDLIERAKNTDGDAGTFRRFQIENYSNDFKQFTQNICESFGFDYGNDDDIRAFIGYLQRIAIKQFPDSLAKSIVKKLIPLVVDGNVENNYAIFLDIVVSGDIWGKKLGIKELSDYIEEKGLKYSLLAKDNRVMPRICELNKEFRESFQAIRGSIFSNKAAQACIDKIGTANHIALHGKAGVGKSGCLENIIDYCEKENIPYLAIKLDRRYPNGSAQKWGEEMGLPTSPTQCISAVSAGKKCVLILDQLDALRWTHANSSTAVEVCKETIREIDFLNQKREEKITIVVVSRTYDLDNDKEIRCIIGDEWEKIEVTELTEPEIRLLVPEYESLSKPLRELLRLPNNVFIWSQLSESKKSTGIKTTFNLIDCWWNVICGLSYNSMDCNTYVNLIVKYCKDRDCIAVPKHAIELDLKMTKYLISKNFIIEESCNYAFVHQSILDFFFAKDMFKDILADKNVGLILGLKDKQTPGRRYQVQQCLQMLCDESVESFLKVGNELLNLNTVRFSYKYIFIEMLAAYKGVSDKLCEYVLSMVDNQKWRTQFSYEVFAKNPEYLRYLMKTKKLDEWNRDDIHADIVNLCLKNMAPEYKPGEAEYLEKRMEQFPDYDWERCFVYDFADDSEDFFELKLKYYNSHPEKFDRYFALPDSMKNCEIRTVRFLASTLRYCGSSRKRQIIQLEEEYINYEIDIIVNSYEEVIGILQPALSEWVKTETTELSCDSYSVARVSIEILKKALRMFASKHPTRYINEYLCNCGSDFRKFRNEIILYSIMGLSEEHSDNVIEFISNNINFCIEDTSKESNKLSYAKQIVARYSVACSEENYEKLEESILYFRDEALERSLLLRINYRHKDHRTRYWRFWGEFQHEMLPTLPSSRLSKMASDLIAVFSRDTGEFGYYQKDSNIQSGRFVSTIANKNLPVTVWSRLVSAKRKARRYMSVQRESGIDIIDNSDRRIAMHFFKAVKENPVEFFNMLIENADTVKPVFVDAFWEAMALYDFEIPLSSIDIKRLISTFSYDYESYRGMCICRVLAKINASKEDCLVDVLVDLAINHKDPEPGKCNITYNSDPEGKDYMTIERNIHNSVRSYAALAIAHNLALDKSLIEKSKAVIEHLANDESVIVRLSALYPLRVLARAGCKWACGTIACLYRNNPLFIGFEYSEDLLSQLYKRYPLSIYKCIRLGAKSSDSYVARRTGTVIAEMYLKENRFAFGAISTKRLNKESCRAIGVRVGYYIADKKFRKRAIRILNKYVKEQSICIDDYIWSNLFYNNLIDPEADRKLISKILRSKANRQVLFSFEKFIAGDIMPFAEDIIFMCNDILAAYPNVSNLDAGWEFEISRAIFTLYDKAIGARKSQVSSKCLDLLDLMYEKGINEARQLSNRIMER